MAKKVDKEKPNASAEKHAAGSDDLEILQPDYTLVIGGQTVTVREYRFFEGLRLQRDEQAFFEDLYKLLSEAGSGPSFDDVLALIGDHNLSVAVMVAQSIDRDLEWVLALGEADGDALLLTWWQVNSSFFIRRVMRRALQKRLEANPSDGRASTTR